MRNFLIALVVASAAVLLGCAAMPSKLQTGKPGKDLVEALVAGLNGGEPGLKAYVEKWCSDRIPAAQRVARMKGIAEQGAPFKLIKIASEKPGEIRALLVDKNGEEIGLKIDTTPDMKMDRVLMGPADMLDAPPPKDYRGYRDLASLCESIRADANCPAMGIAVLQDGKLETASAGVRVVGGTEKVGTDEPWSMGSIGKPICSTVIARLIELGKLRWDTTLGEVLGDLPMKEGYKAVTLEQIMQHRGGIPQDLGMDGPRVAGIVAGAKEPAQIRRNFIKDILGRDLIAKPGERNAYSNAGYALLGAVAEKVSGKTYEALVKELVFKPLDLKQSYVVGDPMPDARPSGHVRGPNGMQSRNFGGPMEVMFAPAGGGLWMSTADLVRFGHAHLEGLKGKDGLLKSETVQRLHRGIPEATGGDFLYGCGWGIERTQDGLVFHGHNGSNGTMRAQLAIFPELNLVVASVVNAGGEVEPAPPLQAAVAVARKAAGK